VRGGVLDRVQGGAVARRPRRVRRLGYCPSGAAAANVLDQDDLGSIDQLDQPC
jgi:hypothetical protein